MVDHLVPAHDNCKCRRTMACSTQAAFLVDSFVTGRNGTETETFVSAVHPCTGLLLAHFKVPQKVKLASDVVHLIPYCPYGSLLLLSATNCLLTWPIAAGVEPVDAEAEAEKRRKMEEAAARKKKKKVTVVHDNKQTRTNTGRGGKSSR